MPDVGQRAVDVLVVGAGQAGLGTADALRRRGVDGVLVVDAQPVGQSWLDRWDSLRLFTPRRFSRLPGLAFPPGPGRSPSREEMAAYLQEYAARLEVTVETGVQVHRLTQVDGSFTAHTAADVVRARQVVLATGPYSRPHVPAAGAGLDPDVPQLHSSSYRRPGDLPTGRVLVVGGGNSAAQLAVELAATREVTVASPGPLRYLPETVLGVDLYWWLRGSGLLTASAGTPVGRAVRRRSDPVIGTRLRELVRSGRVRLLPSRVVRARGARVTLADGTVVPVAAVLWCTGFRPDASWVDVPGALDADGAPLHVRGASPVPGLHWMGLPWQTRLDSSIVHGVGHDARRTARRVARALRG